MVHRTSNCTQPRVGSPRQSSNVSSPPSAYTLTPTSLLWPKTPKRILRSNNMPAPWPCALAPPPNAAAWRCGMPQHRHQGCTFGLQRRSDNPTYLRLFPLPGFVKEFAPTTYGCPTLSEADLEASTCRSLLFAATEDQGLCAAIPGQAGRSSRIHWRERPFLLSDRPRRQIG